MFTTLRPAYLFFFLFLMVFGEIRAQQNYKVACVGFYNFENLFDTINQPDVNDEDFTPEGSYNYTGEVYRDKLHRLATVVSQMGTDLTPDGLAFLGTAEIENITVLQDFVAQPEFKGRGYKIVHYNSPDQRGIDVAFIYNPKYFTVLQSMNMVVPLVDKDGSKRPTRDVLYVKGIFDGDTMHVFVNHWPSRRGGEDASAPGRALAAGVAKAKMDEIRAQHPNAKILLMGDLNDDPVSPSLTKVIGAKGKLSEVPEGGMFNPWTEFYKNGIGTLAYNDSWNLFDQMVVSKSLTNKDQSGYFLMKPVIFKKDFMIQHSGRYRGYPLRTFNGNRYIGGYSDHFPVYLVLLKKP